MLKAISYRNISSNAGLFFGQFQLRHREFIERQHTRSGKSTAWSSINTTPWLPSILFTRMTARQSWLQPADTGRLRLHAQRSFCGLGRRPNRLRRTERVGGDTFLYRQSPSPAMRANICRHICLGYLEFGLALGIERIVGLMPTFILRSVFERSGIVLDRLGPVQRRRFAFQNPAASITVDADPTRSRGPDNRYSNCPAPGSAGQ